MGREPAELNGEYKEMGVVSDAEVMSASTADPAAFAAIFDRHGAALLRYFSARVGYGEAEGLLAEAFRIAFERRASFDLTRSSVLPWLYGIGANLLARHRRTEARRLQALARMRTGPGGPPGEDEVISALDAAALLPRVAEALSALPALDRETLLLYAWEGLGYEDIGRALSVPVGTVRSRINRARSRLREQLRLSGEEQGDDTGGGPP
jgi:RNA polymerase sigma-70 factor (ECF subfamily)